MKRKPRQTAANRPKGSKAKGPSKYAQKRARGQMYSTGQGCCGHTRGQGNDH